MAEAQGVAVSSDTIIAAGCLVTRNADSDTQVLLVHRPKYDDWSLPKGKQHDGEHVIETAVREVAEETGVTVALRQPLPQREYKVSGQEKVVHYWRAEVVVDKGFAPNDEVDEIVWLPIDEALRQATFQPDRDLIEHATDAIATPFVLLRHGHAVKRAAWDGDDVDRPLDPAGVVQSDALVTRLAAYGIDRIHTSAAHRCVQTISPYADVRGLPVVHEPSLTEYAFRDAPKAGKRRVSELLADAVNSGEPTVVCVHRPYLPELIDFLLDGTGLTWPHDTVPVASMIVLHSLEAGSGADPAVTALEHHRL